MLLLQNKKATKLWKIFLITITLLLLWLASLFAVGGFQYENQKIKLYLITIVLMLAFQFYIGDILFYSLWAGISALIPKRRSSKEISLDYDYMAYPEKMENNIYFLKLRVSSVKARLKFGWRHSSEKWNLKYKMISQDLWLFSRYFYLLLLTIIHFWTALPYYNTVMVKRVLSQARLSDVELDDLYTIDDIYEYIDDTIINGFQIRRNLDDKTLLPELGWMQYEMGKIIGVTRLMQKRLKQNKIGLKEPQYVTQSYLPGWKLPYRKLNYLDQYWRIYEAWVVMNTSTAHSIPDRLLLPELDGYLNKYLNNDGYVALLARTVYNSRVVLKYLKEQKWLDDRTSALFIDLIVYNADSNVFGFCTILVERTPFGTVMIQPVVDSHTLLIVLNHLSYWTLFLLFLYFLQLGQFSKVLFLKFWLAGLTALKDVWNMLDAIIVLLNLLIFILFCLRSSSVANGIESIEYASKEEFLDLRGATFFSRICSVCVAILVTVTTIRIWKTLQFAKVFRLYIRTIYLGATSLAYAVFAILLFLFGFAICSYLINITDQTFARTPISLVTLMSFSFGYDIETYVDAHTDNIEEAYDDCNDGDDDNGLSLLGLLLYFVVVFCVTLVFVNILITLTCNYFLQACAEYHPLPIMINCWKFLKMECVAVLDSIKKIFKKSSERKSLKTIKENMQGLLEKRLEPRSSLAFQSVVTSQLLNYGTQRYRMDRLKLLADILLTQTEVLRQSIESSRISSESEDDKESGGSVNIRGA